MYVYAHTWMYSSSERADTTLMCTLKVQVQVQVQVAHCWRARGTAAMTLSCVLLLASRRTRPPAHPNSAPRGSTLRLPRASTLRLALLLCASRFHFAPRASQRSPFLPCALLSSERHSLSAGPPSSCSFSFPALLLGARVCSCCFLVGRKIAELDKMEALPPRARAE